MTQCEMIRVIFPGRSAIIIMPFVIIFSLSLIGISNAKAQVMNRSEINKIIAENSAQSMNTSRVVLKPTSPPSWWNTTMQNVLHGVISRDNNTTPEQPSVLTQKWNAYEKCKGTDIQCQDQLLEALQQTVLPSYSSYSQPRLTQDDYQNLNKTTNGIHDWLLLPPNTYGFTTCENPKSPAIIAGEKAYQDMKDKGLHPPDQLNPWPLLCSTPLDQIYDYFRNHP